MRRWKETNSWVLFGFPLNTLPFGVCAQRKSKQMHCHPHLCGKLIVFVLLLLTWFLLVRQNLGLTWQGKTTSLSCGRCLRGSDLQRGS